MVPQPKKPARPPRAAPTVNPEDEACETLSKIGRDLSKRVLKSKDALITALQTAQSLLEQTAQSSQSVCRASRELAAALPQDDLLHHPDSNVRLAVACCTFQLLRIYAPESPYSDAEIKRIFRLLSRTLGSLVHPNNPHFEACLNLVSLVNEMKAMVLLLDVEADPPPSRADATLCECLGAILDAVNEDNSAAVSAHLEPLLELTVSEADVTTGLLDTLLSRLIPPPLGEASAGAALVRRVLRRCEETLGPSLQRLATLCLEDGPQAVASDLAEDGPALWAALFVTLPRLGRALLPQLALALRGEDDRRRERGVVALGALLTWAAGGRGEGGPGWPASDAACDEAPPEMDAEARDATAQLAELLLERQTDVRPSLRVAALQALARLGRLWAPLGMTEESGAGDGEGEESDRAEPEARPGPPPSPRALFASLARRAFAGLTDRLLDADEHVRVAALAAVARAAAKEPRRALPGGALRTLCARLRDRRAGVRAGAGAALAELARSWAWPGAGGEAGWTSNEGAIHKGLRAMAEHHKGRGEKGEEAQETTSTDTNAAGHIVAAGLDMALLLASLLKACVGSDAELAASLLSGSFADGLAPLQASAGAAAPAIEARAWATAWAGMEAEARAALEALLAGAAAFRAALGARLAGQQKALEGLRLGERLLEGVGAVEADSRALAAARALCAEPADRAGLGAARKKLRAALGRAREDAWRALVARTAGGLFPDEVVDALVELGVDEKDEEAAQGARELTLCLAKAAPGLLSGATPATLTRAVRSDEEEDWGCRLVAAACSSRTKAAGWAGDEELAAELRARAERGCVAAAEALGALARGEAPGASSALEAARKLAASLRVAGRRGGCSVARSVEMLEALAALCKSLGRRSTEDVAEETASWILTDLLPGGTLATWPEKGDALSDSLAFKAAAVECLGHLAVCIPSTSPTFSSARTALREALESAAWDEDSCPSQALFSAAERSSLISEPCAEASRGVRLGALRGLLALSRAREASLRSPSDCAALGLAYCDPSFEVRSEVVALFARAMERHGALGPRLAAALAQAGADPQPGARAGAQKALEAWAARGGGAREQVGREPEQAAQFLAWLVAQHPDAGALEMEEEDGEAARQAAEAFQNMWFFFVEALAAGAVAANSGKRGGEKEAGLFLGDHAAERSVARCSAVLRALIACAPAREKGQVEDEAARAGDRIFARSVALGSRAVQALARAKGWSLNAGAPGFRVAVHKALLQPRGEGAAGGRAGGGGWPERELPSPARESGGGEAREGSLSAASGVENAGGGNALGGRAKARGGLDKGAPPAKRTRQRA